MDLQSKVDELKAAWRALGGSQNGDGWQTISIASQGQCKLLAGRHFPGNEEALLLGFTLVRVPPPDQLPQGKGFLVTKADIIQGESNRVWIALLRQSAGSLELFSLMTEDIVKTLETLSDCDDERIFNLILARIRAWQDFMQKDGESILSHEKEIGLFGELEVLRELILGGVSPKNAITSWQGPLNGVQDFEFGSGAIEVKTTISTSSFLVNIGSLDQLDDSKKCPLFICGIRLALSISGITICDLVNELRELLSGDSYVKWLFDGRLVQAGYFDSNSDSYTRRFLNEEKKVFQVTSVFPHLTRMSVPIEIKSACYEIDLNMLSIEDFGFKAALKQLGVIE